MTQPTIPTAPAGRPQGAAAGAAALAIQRQFVSFAFFKLDPAFRRLGAEEKAAAREEFLKVFATPQKGMITLVYSTVGMKADCDFLLWRISLSPDDFQAQQQAMNQSRLGGYLSQPYSFLCMTKRSTYLDKLDPFHTPESRTHIIP